MTLSRATLALALALVVGCNRTPSSAPTPAAPPAARDVSVAAPTPPPTPVAPAAPVDAGPPVALIVRVKNVGPTPLRILTNPDANEMLHAFHLAVSPTTSDRAAMFANGPRVKFFPVGQMALCGSDAGGGYGGLGQPGERTLAPNESFEIARWDGILREEVNDPAQGVCQRQTPAAPGRYRLQLDQPQLHGGPQCTRVLVPVPATGDGGAPTVEIQCHAYVPDGG